MHRQVEGLGWDDRRQGLLRRRAGIEGESGLSQIPEACHSGYHIRTLKIRWKAGRKPGTFFFPRVPYSQIVAVLPVYMPAFCLDGFLEKVYKYLSA